MAATITSLLNRQRPAPGAFRGQLPICESQLAKTWRVFIAKPPYPEGNLEAFIARFNLYGPVANELWKWVKAGCPHVCGR